MVSAFCVPKCAAIGTLGTPQPLPPVSGSRPRAIGSTTVGHSALASKFPSSRSRKPLPGMVLRPKGARSSNDARTPEPSLAWQLESLRRAKPDSFLRYDFSTLSGGRSMWLEDHGRLEKFLSPSPDESDSVTARGNG